MVNYVGNREHRIRDKGWVDIVDQTRFQEEEAKRTYRCLGDTGHAHWIHDLYKDEGKRDLKQSKSVR